VHDSTNWKVGGPSPAVIIRVRLELALIGIDELIDVETNVLEEAFRSIEAPHAWVLPYLDTIVVEVERTNTKLDGVNVPVKTPGIDCSLDVWWWSKRDKRNRGHGSILNDGHLGFLSRFGAGNPL
jgi:hypothetical protein